VRRTPAVGGGPRLRIGLLGCGRAARLIHLDALAAVPALEVVAVADADRAHREAARARFPAAAAAADYRDVLANDAVDAVLVALPTSLHAEAACAAFGAGKHVYVEKPLARSVGEGEEIVAAWEASGRVGMVGFNLRFDPVYVRARDLVRAGAVGTPVAARTVFSAAPRALPPWKQRRATGGGALLDLGSHHADLVRFLFSEEFAAVSAAVRSRRTEEDTAVVTSRLASGLAVQSFFSLAATEDDRLEVHGDEGLLLADRYRARSPVVVPGRRPGSRRERLAQGVGAATRAVRSIADTLVPPGGRSHERALAAFAAAVLDGAATAADPREGLASLHLVAAAERAAAAGATVPVAASDAVAGRP
jgi:predicted dehydrogenase